MIILTSNKFVLVKVGFSIRDPIHLGSMRSTPRQMACPGDFALPEKQSRVVPTYTTRQDGTTPVIGL
jgi:hypothetical protein